MAEGTHVCGVEGDDEHVHWRESVPCGVMWQRSGTGGVGPPRVEYRTEGGDRRRGVEEGGGDPWLAWARRGWFFWLVWVAEGMRECGRRGGCTGAARVGRGVRRDGAWLSTSEAGGDGRGAEGSAEVVRGESKGRMGGGGGCGTLARHAGFSHDKGWQSRTLGVWAAASGGYDWVAAAFSLVGWLADGLHGLGLVVGGRRSSMLFSAGWGLLGFNRFGALCLGVGFLLLSFAFFLLMWCSVVQTFLSFAGDQLEACALLVRACVLVGVGEVCAGLDGFFDSALRLLLLRLLADVAAVAMGVAEAFRRAAVSATDNMCTLAYGINELDPGSARGALEFKRIMDATPADLKNGPTNIYSQIAIALKGGELREPGLANLAARLAVRVRLAPVSVPEPEHAQQNSPRSLRNSSNQSRTSGRQSRKTGKHQELAATPEPADHSHHEGSTGGIWPGDEEEASAAAGAIPREVAVAVESSV